MKSQITILITVFALGLSSIASANETFWNAVAQKRFADALRILETDETVDIDWKPTPQSRNAASMVVDRELEQVELLKRIASKKNNNARPIPHDEMRKYAKMRDTSKVIERFPTGLEKDEYGSSFFHWVCFEGSVQLVEYYADKLGADVINTAFDLVGDLPLHYALTGKNDTAVNRLIKDRALLENRDQSLGETALIRAAQIGRTSTLKLLIKAGAQLDATDFLGATALHWAALKGHDKVVEALLIAGADATLVSLVGTTPLSNAAGKHPKVEKLLRKHLKVPAQTPNKKRVEVPVARAEARVAPAPRRAPSPLPVVVDVDEDSRPKKAAKVSSSSKSREPKAGKSLPDPFVPRSRPAPAQPSRPGSEEAEIEEMDLGEDLDMVEDPEVAEAEIQEWLRAPAVPQPVTEEAPARNAPPVVDMGNLEHMFKQFVGEVGPEAAWALMLGFQMGKDLK